VKHYCAAYAVCAFVWKKHTQLSQRAAIGLLQGLFMKPAVPVSSLSSLDSIVLTICCL